MVQGLLWKKIGETPSQWKKLGTVICTCTPATAGSINERVMVQVGPGKKPDPILITRAKRDRGMTRACLTNMKF
jgi:hypothetical protein